MGNATVRMMSPVAQARERLLHGEAALSDADLLAVCLGTGYRGVGVNRLAQTLLEQFGGVAGLLDASGEELCRLSGLGPARVAALKAVLALAERYYADRLETRETIGGSDQVMSYLRGRFAGATREIFGCLFLDTRHRLIQFEKLFFGSIDRATVYPREIVRRALELNAAALVLAHNHPSGIPEPSISDLRLTESLVKLLIQLDIVVLDHVIVGSSNAVSFAERGLI